MYIYIWMPQKLQSCHFILGEPHGTFITPGHYPRAWVCLWARLWQVLFTWEPCWVLSSITSPGASPASSTPERWLTPGTDTTHTQTVNLWSPKSRITPTLSDLRTLAPLRPTMWFSSVRSKDSTAELSSSTSRRDRSPARFHRFGVKDGTGRDKGSNLQKVKHHLMEGQDGHRCHLALPGGDYEILGPILFK